MIKVKGELTYTSQQPWILAGTVRSNILFGKELNPKKYERVLRACALKRVRIPLNLVFHHTFSYAVQLSHWQRYIWTLTQDMDLLPGGDMAMVGDRGANLSGGQKARVSLARCAG